MNIVLWLAAVILGALGFLGWLFCLVNIYEEGKNGGSSGPWLAILSLVCQGCVVLAFFLMSYDIQIEGGK